MFGRFILWLSHLLGLLCEFIMPCTPVTQTPSTPASQTQLSLVSSSTPTKYDVFLSFRGEDTRLNFTGHLYQRLDDHGIRTFMDDPELRGGEVISDALTRAIHESKTYIVVLSQNYATSPWCLNELVEILNCHKTAQRLVIPVFFNIHPSVVRHRTGSFKQAFKKHQKRFPSEREKLENWQLTLKEVADFSGHHISKDRSEADVTNKIVHELLLLINPRTLDVAKYPVGLDSRVKYITALFSSDKEGVIRIGIHGMGGVGKTTLAKAVYNQNYRSFHGSCFLADVREVSTRENGLVSLQQKLIDNVMKCKNERIDNVDQGIELIRARICSKKVLIVIDDLDKLMPLEFLVGPFAMGSIVIITTRNEDLLDSVKVEARYKVNGLGDAESRQLFMQHAFGDNEIPDTFTELSQEILEHAGGLPLALKVFGSNLLNQPEGDWRWFINKLKRVPIEDVENKLIISFQALKSVDPMLQNIYLDIACFFVGRKKKEVVNIMETCYTFVNHHIDILNKRCLLTTDDEDELGMHDLLQDMGRNIARNESPDEPEKRSRLWVSKDICDVLKKTKGTEAVECIIPQDNNKDALKGLSFTTKTFKTMSKLRFLHLKEVNITGSFEQIFEDLRLLRWEYCLLQCLPSEFDPPKLVILELPDSKLRTVWEQNMVSHVFGKLKTLNVSYSRDLVATPDFIKLPSLETLNLKGCESLEEVHISVGSLMRLDSLNLMGCKKLRSLPDTICNLRALQELVLSWSGITALPSGFSQLSNLQSLKLDWCNHLFSIPKLPSNLKHIDARRRYSLERIPNLSNLKHLERLDLTNCSGLTYIQGLEDLISIRSLHLRGSSGLTNKHLTKRLFKVYSEFGHQINVEVSEYIDQWSDWILESPYWTSKSESTTVYAHLLPNESHNFMGIILCFYGHLPSWKFGYSVKNTTSGFIWSGSLDVPFFESLIVVVPKSIFSVTDEDHSIEFTADNNTNIVGIHLLYKTETKTIEDVEEKHVVDIDALKLIDPVLHDIFLDIACFFIGWEKKKVVQILETYYTNVDHHIDFLKSTCLLKINYWAELEMDHLLQHLGRKIACNNSPDEPEKHSRLWLSIDIYDALKNHKGKEAIEGIIPRRLDDQKDALVGEYFTMETFKRLSKLRFLYLKKVHLTGSFEQAFKELRWFCWDFCPLKCLPSDFCPQELVTLELPHSNMTTFWEPNVVSNVYGKLKTLNMSYSQDLITTPDFIKLPCLENLNLENCKSLEEVHMSIGSLAWLVSLDLHGCAKLRSLPDTICNLRSLEILDVEGCSSLATLPTEIGNIESLNTIYQFCSF